MTDEEKEERLRRHNLLLWMRGWRKGAGGSVADPDGMKHPVYFTGHNEGRIAAGLAYSEACKFWKTTLSVLREDEVGVSEDKYLPRSKRDCICLRCDSETFIHIPNAVIEQEFEGVQLFVTSPGIICVNCGWLTIGIDQADELVRRTIFRQQRK